MEKYSTRAKMGLGLFVIAGLALLVAGIFYIGRQKHLFNPTFYLSTTFRNIGGLQIGNNVRFLGINVGTVENIEIINDTTVKVHLIIDKDVQQFIKADSYVHISSDGLIGDKVAQITSGSPHSAKIIEGQQLSSVEPLETDAILKNLNETGENATIVSGQLAEILYEVNHGNGIVARLIRDSTIADNVDYAIRYLKRSSRGLDENIEAAKHNIFFRGYFRNKNKKKEAEENKTNTKSKGNSKTGKTSNKQADKKSWLDLRKEKRQERKKKREEKKAAKENT
jgi:phospholipid/cholesterol/gamma-HCH transport system substrate-binding protein